MSEKDKKTKPKSLRLVSPNLYQYITDEFQEKHNIHSYDLQIDAVTKDEGIHVTIRFGETFSNTKEQFFTYKQIDEISNEIKKFVADAGESCTQVMIDDYFKIYAP